MTMADFDLNEGMSPRKQMASSKGGDFGCEPLSSMSKGNGEMHSAKPIKDEDRAAGKPIKHSSGKHPSQANPDHGPHGMDD